MIQNETNLSIRKIKKNLSDFGWEYKREEYPYGTANVLNKYFMHFLEYDNLNIRILKVSDNLLQAILDITQQEELSSDFLMNTDQLSSIQDFISHHEINW